jgi:YHS domain-containing protein
METEEGKICSEYQGRRYCFCSQACKQKFEAMPEKFIERKETGGCCG